METKVSYYKSEHFFAVGFEIQKPFYTDISVVFFKAVQSEDEYNRVCIKNTAELQNMVSREGKRITINTVEEYQLIFEEPIRKAILDLVFPIEEVCKEKCYLYTYCKKETYFYAGYLSEINKQLQILQEKLTIK